MATRKATPKKTEEKKESPTTTIQISRELRATIDELPGDTAEDKIRGLMIQKIAVDIPDDGLIPLRLTGRSYRTLIMALGSTPELCDILWKARVTG